MEGIDRRNRMVLLNDLYGALMTDRRSEALRLWLEEDLSLQEIAELTGVSRQAVHDAVLRAEARLESYEAALGLLRRREEQMALLREARARLARITGAEEDRAEAVAVAALLDALEETDPGGSEAVGHGI